MVILKRSIGLSTLLLAVLGLLLCVGGIIGIWAAKSRVDAVGTVMLGTADDALAFVDTKLDRVKQVLDESRHRAGGISRIAERLKNAQADAKKECEPLLQVLDEVCQKLKSAKSWVDSSHAVASGISRVSQAVISSDFAASRQGSIGVAVAIDLQQFADAVADVLARLQAMRLELIELRDTGKLTRGIAVAFLARLADLDGRLANLAGRIENLDARVAATRASCADFGARMRRWTVVAVVMAKHHPGVVRHIANHDDGSWMAASEMEAMTLRLIPDINENVDRLWVRPELFCQVAVDRVVPVGTPYSWRK